MKTITITMEDNVINVNDEGFTNAFEVNGLLQTILLHRCMTQFGVDSGAVNVVEESKAS